MKHESNLHKAFAEMGLTTMDFQNGGETYSTALDELPAETLVKIMTYGKRIFNDAVNGAVHGGQDREEAARNWLDKAKAGALGTRAGGGGSRISPLEKEIRAIVEEYLKAAGWKAADAKKRAKDAKDAFADVIRGQIARAKSIPEAKVDEAAVAAALDANWPKVEKMAVQRLEIAQGGLNIEL